MSSKIAPAKITKYLYNNDITLELKEEFGVKILSLAEGCEIIEITLSSVDLDIIKHWIEAIEQANNPHNPITTE